MPIEEKEFDYYLEKHTLKDLNKRTLNGTYIYLAAWLLIGGGTGFYAKNEVLYWSFAGLFLVIGLIRISTYLYFSKVSNRSNSVQLKWHYINMLLPSLVFSVLLSLAFYAPEFEGLLIYLLMALFALLSAGTANFSPIIKMSFAFVFALTMLPFITAMLLAEARFVEGLMLLLYAFYMLIQAIRLNKEYLLHLKQQFKLNKLNQQDSLTGIANRRYFDESMNKFWKNALRSQTSLSLILIDIDFFKRVNDQFGHPAGDEVIKSVASAILSVCKRDTDIVARLGGEEYAALLNNCDSKVVQNFAEKIRKAIEAIVVEVDDKKINVTASVGASFTIPTMEQNAADFYKVADESMYSAKDSGRNLVMTNEYKI